MQSDVAQERLAAAEDHAPPSNLDRHGRTLLTATLSLVIVAALALKLRLVFSLNVNWDEFYYLHWIYVFSRGELSNQFQTFHVHFFGWLGKVATNEVDQIIVARLIIYGLSVASSALTFLIARRFFDRLCSLFVLSCYLSFSAVIEHGTSFRVDPIAAFLFLMAVYCVIRLPTNWLGAIIAGTAIAFAVMLTIKSAFYLPVFAAIFLIDIVDRQRRHQALQNLLIFGSIFALVLAGLYRWHEGSLSAPTFDAAADFVATSAGKVIRLNEFFPQWRYFLQSLLDDAALWGILIFGIACLFHRSFQKGFRPERSELFLMAFLLPLATLAFYRNAYPYFYVFILSPAILASGIGFQRLLPTPAKKPGELMPWLVASMLVLAVATNMFQDSLSGATDQTRTQRQTVELVHKLFPKPVPYFDRTTMIASFPDVGFFMSSWGIEVYLERNEPVFRNIIKANRPPFYIADLELLDPRIEQEPYREAGLALLSDDYAALRENYVHHWGDLFVAGKTFSFANNEPLSFDMLIPGRYTLEATVPLEIDGAVVPPGETIQLSEGPHRARLQAKTGGTAVLRWGDHLYRPEEPPVGATFTGF